MRGISCAALCLHLCVQSAGLVGLGTPGYGYVQQRQDADTTSYEFELEGISAKIVESVWGDEAYVINLKGINGYEGEIYRLGEPGIPVVRFFVDGDASIDIAAGEHVEDYKPLDEKIFPQQIPQSKMAGAQLMPFMMNHTVYASDEYMPAKLYDIVPAGSLRGVKRQLVTLHPYQYKPKTGEHRLHTHFTVKVSYPSGKRPAAAATVSDKDAIVFVVGKQFKHSAALAKYRELKHNQGYFTYVEPVETVDAETPKRIRERLRRFYQSVVNLKHVIIVGDHEDVPGYPSQEMNGSYDYDTDAYIAFPTDHTYALLDQEDAEADIATPDVGIGRISARTEAQLATILNKYTRYQNGQFRNDDWLERASFIATDDVTYYKIAEASHDYVTGELMTTFGWQGHFPSKPQRGGDRLYAIRHEAAGEHLVAALAEGRGVINYSGHGATDEWDAPKFTIADLDGMSADAIPVVVSNACITGQYNLEQSFAEAWQRHAKGGVLFWGSVDSTYWQEDDRLERRFYEELATGRTPNFADLTNLALTDLWRYYGGENRSAYYWDTYQVFSDPSIQIRTRKTQIPALKVSGGTNASPAISLTLNNREGKPVANARLGLRFADGTLAGGMTDAKGRLDVPVEASKMHAGQGIQFDVSGGNLRTMTFQHVIYSE